MWSMITRALDLSRVLGKTRSAFLFGPRGVGKTLLARELLAREDGGIYIDLLNLDTYRRYLNEPELFRLELEQALSRGVLTVVVDEVQKLPGLLDEVHHLLEKYKKKIRFLLTSSSARKLKRGGANLLAARAWTLKLHPLSSFEIDLDIRRALQYGTLPAIYLEDETPHRTLKAYVDTYLKEEILQESLVRKAENFIRFLEFAGQMNGEPVNFAKVAREAGVTTKTAQEYFSILVDTLVAVRVDGWSHSVRKQLRQSPKYYFFDCGVLNAMRGELHVDLRRSTYRYGRLFETFLINELHRLNDNQELDYRFFYWRTNTGQEVDLILSRGVSDRPCAIEIKSNQAPSESDMKGLKAFRSEHEDADLFCFCLTPRAYSLGDVTVLPWQEGLTAIKRR
jgi:uncharacterized protein